ncbi:MAG: hypothetical protein DRI75_04080, partial [Bacteroidetes bacterium]
VILNYREAIKREGKKDNVVIIDGQRNINEIFDEVWEITSKLLEFKSDDKKPIKRNKSHS